MDDLFNDIENFLDNPKPKLLTEKEVERLIISLATMRGIEGSFTEDECVSVIKWAEATRVAATMLSLILDGDCDIDWQDEDVLIRLSDQGRERNRGSNI